ncbi:MAG: FkbM family methyltransferase [Bryobacteraceae bacterium]|nr:FkbM family methyltransferase [Bryobacteraceae bacterium]
MLTSLVNGMQISIPRSLEGVAPVSPNNLDFAYEPYCWLGLDAVLGEGGIAYDAGAAHGLMSVMMRKRVGERGKVHAFEANPSTLPVTREVLSANGCEVVLSNLCVGDASGGEADFYCAPGLDAVASSRNVKIAAKFPGAQRIRVPLVALDDYAAQHSHTPAVIKLDIEGSEHLAVKGARRIMERSHPHWVIETHPEQMGEGTSLVGMCELLEHSGYELFDLYNGTAIRGRDYAKQHERKFGYLMACVRIPEGLRDRHRQLKARFADRERQEQTMVEARRLAGADPSRAVRLLRIVLAETPGLAEAHYLLAFSLQALRSETGAAIAHYETALRLGFDPFWVRYNLGALLFDSGERDAAREQMLMARELDPAHEGVRFYLNQL